MPWPTELNQLESVLADLYPREEDGRRIAESAGLETGSIRFDSQANLNWHAILRCAVIEERLEATIGLIRAEHPGSSALSEAVSRIDEGIAGAAKATAEEEEAAEDEEPAGEPARVSRWKSAFLVGLIVPLAYLLWYLHEAEKYRAGVFENPKVGSVVETVEDGNRVEILWEDYILRELTPQQESAIFSFLARERLRTLWATAYPLYGILGGLAYYWILLAFHKGLKTSEETLVRRLGWDQILARLLLAALAGFVLYQSLMAIGWLTGWRPPDAGEVADSMRSIHDIVVFTTIPVGLSVGMLYAQGERLAGRLFGQKEDKEKDDDP